LTFGKAFLQTGEQVSDKGFCEKGMGLVNSPHVRRIMKKDLSDKDAQNDN
jgi:hypothetical protein